MEQNNTNNAVVGNAGLSSCAEDYIAACLKELNLDMVNRTSDPVRFKDGIYTRYIKRCLDIDIALLALLVSAPVNLTLAACTYFDVGKPIIFRQTRIGKDGKPFQIIKFRNMTNETDENGVLLPPSQRVTKFGKFVRKYSLDELLNFWSVLKGDMSIIGPRPLPAFFYDRYSERHKMRCAVRPGLECPRAIVEDKSVSKYHMQFENDIWYVENVSFATDCKMVLKLFTMTFDFKHRSKAAGVQGYFVGYDEDGKAISFKKIVEKHPEYLEAYNRHLAEAESAAET